MSFLVAFLFCIALAIADEAQNEEFASGTKLHSVDLYNQLLTDNDNFIVSPYSLETLLALVQSGAKDATGEQIRSGLHLPETQEETESVIKAVLPVIQDNVVLVSLNRIISEGDAVINEEFRQVAVDVYQAHFQNSEELVGGTAANLSASLNIILKNDISFTASWAVPFDGNSVKNSKFYKSKDLIELVDYITQETEEYNYYEDSELDAQILEIPFKGDEITITIVLPNEIDGLTDLEKQIDKALATPEFTKENIQVALPKFTVANIIDLKDVLKKLGVEKVFDSSEVDLSGIAGAKGELVIQEISQKSDIFVNEGGVGVAIDTQIETQKMSSSAPNKSFTADHPFIFYFKVHNVIVFVGRLLDPS